MKIAAEYCFGDMCIRYILDEEMHVGLEIFPALRCEKIIKEKTHAIDSIVQWKKAGDAFPYGFANGVTMRNSESVLGMKWRGQKAEKTEDGIRVITLLENEEGICFTHTVGYRSGETAVTVDIQLENKGKLPAVIEMLSSFSVGGISLFQKGEGTNCLVVHKMRSKWSGEGRMESRTAEELLLEPTWSRHGVYSDKFGQLGSLPVRGYFPFVAVEDIEEKVVWAAAIDAPSSWQMEVYRRDDALCISGGLADYDYGHWCKKVYPGEYIKAPRAYLTVCNNNVDSACQRLSNMWKSKEKNKKSPIIFNEFCTTWGNPSHKNISRILDAIKDCPIDIFVIDAGWYADSHKGWENNMGDWEISEDLFPDGMKKTVDEIKSYGMIPGIWFEIETCGKDASVYQKENHLLKRNGSVITSGGRRFWDMNDPWVIDYLEQKVIGFLKKYGFGYLKIDYNESIGIGCDGAESLGEGLRQNILAAKTFFERIREKIPGIMIEICASGGHRMEPSMLMFSDMVSFSDAHEEREIPIIASNIQRLVPAEKSQIWAVMRKQDSPKRIVYSIINTFFGIMCISGDIFSLSQEQWKYLKMGMNFYRQVSHIIRDGQTCYFGTKLKSWRKPEGWQAIVRYSEDKKEALCIIHRFEETGSTFVRLDLDEVFVVKAVYEAEVHNIQCCKNELTVKLDQDYEAIAVYLKREK